MTAKVRISAEDPAEVAAITEALARVPHQHTIRAAGTRADRPEIEGNTK